MTGSTAQEHHSVKSGALQRVKMIPLQTQKLMRMGIAQCRNYKSFNWRPVNGL